MITFEEVLIDSNSTPLIWQIRAGVDAGVPAIRGWLADHRELYNQRLDQHGAVLIRGFERLQTAEDFEAVLGALDGELLDYVGGTSPRHAVRGRIMTATEVPGDYSIPLHQEMSYTAHPPQRISFFCVTPAATGGETTVADMRKFTAAIDPALLARFKERGTQLRRNLPSPEGVQARPGVPKPWTQVFATDDRDAALRAAATRGWRAEWLSDGSLQLWQEVLPATRIHPRTHDEVWFNQVHIFSPVAAHRWAVRDGRTALADRIETAFRKAPELLDDVFYGDGSPIVAADVLQIAEMLDDAAIPLAWHAGDFLMLDNVLSAHGRRQYDGERSILTALINERRAMAELAA